MTQLNTDIETKTEFNPHHKENEEIKKQIEIKYKEFNEYFNRQWKSFEEKNEYKLYYFDEKIGLRSIKAETIINKNIKTVYDFLIDLNNKSKYDTNFDTGHLIRQIDQQYSIQYLKYKGKVFISPRDFVVISYKIITDDKIVLFSTSYISDKYPKNNKIERAELKVNIFYFSLVATF